MLFIYVHPKGRRRLHVDGFSWSAACLQPLWALRHDMPVAAVLMTVTYVLLEVVLTRWTTDSGTVILQALWCCAQGAYVGRHAARWDEQALLQNGYRLAASDVVQP